MFGIRSADHILDRWQQLAASPLGSRPSGSSLLAVASVGTFLALMSYTLPLSDVVTLTRVLAAGPVTLAWVLGSMSVGLTAVMLIVGTLADRYGRRLLFQLGLAVLVLGTLICVLSGVLPISWRAVVFVIGRVVQGVGSAAIIASALALLGVGFPQPHQRAAASSVWAAALGAGITTGPFAAAGADRLGHWWLAYLAVAAGAAGLMVTSALRIDESLGARQRLDLPGAVTFVSATLLIMVGLIMLRSATPTPVAAAVIVVALLIFVAFVGVERRAASPMFDPALLADRRFAAVHLAAGATGLGSIGLLSLSGTFMITDLHTSVLQSAIMIGIWAATGLLVSLLSRWLPAWISGGRQLALGLLIGAGGQLLMINVEAVGELAPGMFIAGIGAGVVNAGLGRETVASAPDGRVGFGSGVNNTARYLGSAIGIAIAALLLTTVGWPATVVVASLMLLAGAVGVLVLQQRRS